MSNFNLVKQFHEAFKCHPLASPTYTPEQLNAFLRLRFNLLFEEYQEGTLALDKLIAGNYEAFFNDYIDSLVDMLYVIYGTLDLLGVDADAAFKEVHRSNMSKLDDNGEPIINDGILDPRRPAGKILKSKNFSEPNLSAFVEQAMDGFTKHSTESK